MFHPQIITEIILQVANKEKTDQILAYSKNVYDLHQFNIGTLYPKDVRKMNDSLKRRYKREEIQTLPTNWNEGERRLFVWFIVCFLYLKQITIDDITESDLVSLSEVFYGKDTIFLDFQLRNLPRAIKAKRSWSEEEDELLKKAILALKGDLNDPKPFNNWNDVAKMIFFQTQRKIFRTPKSCRQRWYNHLDQSKKKDDFTMEQDLTLINYILTESKAWSKIVKIMNYSRTQHRIKNRYYTLIRKYQKSFNDEMVEEMSEKKQREVLQKLKALYEATLGQQKNSGELFLASANLKSNNIKSEQKESLQNGDEKKTQSRSQQMSDWEVNDIKKRENNGLYFQQVEAIKPKDQQISNNKSSSNQSSKQHSIITANQEKDHDEGSQNPIIPQWKDSYMPMQMYWNSFGHIYEQPICVDFSQHMIINQYYYPIMIPNVIDCQHQFYYKN